mmetsp:Transcript_22535/g.44619  ORF Transcript_22535/g.44619 Transcript_22535/m.44619 type:complete len:88 (+) Transcript_22535:669-932(+)
MRGGTEESDPPKEEEGRDGLLMGKEKNEEQRKRKVLLRERKFQLKHDSHLEGGKRGGLPAVRGRPSYSVGWDMRTGRGRGGETTHAR